MIRLTRQATYTAPTLSVCFSDDIVGSVEECGRSIEAG